MNKETSENSHKKLSEIQSILTEGLKADFDQDIDLLNKKIHDPEHFGNIIDQAIRHNINKKPEVLSKELFSTVESSLMQSIKTNPNNITNIIAPVIAPAIRKSVAETMKSFIESTNQIVEASLSPTSLKWRLQSYITGKSYSDIVFANTVEYRVDYLFLINKKSGILIEHAISDSSLGLEKDEDLVSSMLTAIRDFSKDVFHTNASKNQSDGLHKLELGDQTIIIEDGSLAYIAAVITGIPPISLSTTMKEIIEHINIELCQNDDLDSINEDSKSKIIAFMQNGLLSKKINKEEEETSPNKKAITKIITFGILGSVFLSIIFYSGMFLFGTSNKSKLLTETKNYINTLNHQAGILVTSHSINDEEIVTINGLKDNFSKIQKPNSKILKDKIHYNWKSYISTDPITLTRRLKAQLNLPKSIKLTLIKNVIHVSGKAPKEVKTRLINAMKFYINSTPLNFSNFSSTDQFKKGG